jgi:uncharacterized protein (UPF0276 family)
MAVAPAACGAPRIAQPVPATAGIGLRAPHQCEVLDERPAIAWLEVHAENYFGEAGAQVEILCALAQTYPLSLHGVGLSLGSADPLDRTHLRRLRRLAERVGAGLLSEHASWGSIDGRHVHDLLPLPYCAQALAHLGDRLDEAQNELGRELLVENVSSYVEFSASTMTEWDFMAALVARTGCRLLLDVNNVYVSAMNHGYDPYRYLDALPRNSVGEIHLAGHTVVERDGHRLLVDTHSTRVCEPVWALYGHALRRFGRTPTLIEWDSELPALATLRSQAQRAATMLADDALAR